MAKHLRPNFPKRKVTPMAQRKANGEAILALREALGIKQYELAERCGITAASLSAIERGHYDASPGLIRELARHLGVGVGAITSFPASELAS